MKIVLLKSQRLEEGDLIISFNGQSISDPSNLKKCGSLSSPDKSSKVKSYKKWKEKNHKCCLRGITRRASKLAKKNDIKPNQFGFKLKKDRSNGNALVVSDIDINGEAYQKGIREGDIIKRVGTQKNLIYIPI